MTGGLWVFVCGPSGAGKDSVIGWAADALLHDARIAFAPRRVTRAAGPTSTDQETSAAALARLRADGALVWYWEAHGLAYGVDAQQAARVGAGCIVVVNGSRAHAAGLAGRAEVRRVAITAPRELLAQRLLGRGREGADAMAQRLTRSDEMASVAWDLEIANDGALATAGLRLAAYLNELAK